jgi:GDP-D-mannose dehydratase
MSVQNKDGKRVLITGITGFVDSYLAKNSWNAVMKFMGWRDVEPKAIIIEISLRRAYLIRLSLLKEGDIMGKKDERFNFITTI